MFYTQAQLELACTDLREQLESNERSMMQAQSELGDLNRRITKKSDELTDVKPQYEDAEKRERDSAREYVLLFSNGTDDIFQFSCYYFFR